MTIIIDNIITPYEIARYNAINKVLKGKLEVWFQVKTIVNNEWNYFPRIQFKYRFLNDGPLNLNLIKLFGKYKGKIDRIICCGWDSLVCLYTFWFCQRNKIRFTLWSGSTIFEKSWRRKISLPFVKFIINKADDYIAYGTRAKDYLISLGAKENKIKIFLNSVDVDYFHQEAMRLRKIKNDLRKKYDIGQMDAVFLYVGQLIERKGVRELVEAFKGLSFSSNQIILVIVGEGVLREELESFIRDHPEVKIRLLSYLSYNKLPEVYALSDALVLPSKEEVWGLVVNEALASGIPVLVSKFAGCVPDLVDKDNGEIIEEVSPKGIEAVLNKFLKKKKYMISSETLEKMRNEIYAEEVFTN